MKNALLLIAALVITINLSAKEINLILVRHAEKKAGNNPSLTIEGLKRAQSLLHIEKALKLKISKVYSSKAMRTIQTATPLSEYLNLEIINSIDPRDYHKLKEDILMTEDGMSSFLVGHSNTVPEFINFLYPVAGLSWISEKNFSRLFMLSIKDNEVVHYQEYLFRPVTSGIELELIE